ncbi:MAG TPA: winged helix DNA-binding domain-containing protein [Gaiellales bacterium]|nr:winged helix DNA-binding domain-containing protein [Gaiellales bacterium]
MIAERLCAQLLSGRPARTAVDVAERLLAVQAQDARGVRLAVRARTRGLSVADFDRALTEERSLVINWLNRGTLHLVRSEDHAWLHSLAAPGLARAGERRLEQEGVSRAAADRAVAAIERALGEEGPLTRAQLGERVAALGVRTEGQALIHILFAACVRGVAVRGPMIARQHAYALARDWLGVQKLPERDVALGELARRYLAGHGPAGERDLARWAGLPLRDARAGLARVGRELRVRRDGLLALAGRRAARSMPRPRLLGAFDPLLLGWCSREEILGEQQARVVLGGMFRPFALVGGRGVATWRVDGGRVVLEPFGRLAGGDCAALEEDGRDALRYLALEREA